LGLMQCVIRWWQGSTSRSLSNNSIAVHATLRRIGCWGGGSDCGSCR
jgi:hypothetical protein